MSGVLCGIDGGDTSRAAAVRAAELARAFDEKLYLLMVVPRVPAAAAGVAVAAEAWIPEAIEGAKQLADSIAEDVAGDLDHEVIVCEGSPAASIVNKAQEHDVDLIVVGNVRMQGVGRILGSVGSHVVHHAPCDVLIVKTV